MKQLKTIIRSMRTASEQEEKDYHKTIRAGSFWNNSYIEYESSGDRNKNLSVKAYVENSVNNCN